MAVYPPRRAGGVRIVPLARVRGRPEGCPVQTFRSQSPAVVESRWRPRSDVRRLNLILESRSPLCMSCVLPQAARGSSRGSAAAMNCSTARRSFASRSRVAIASRDAHGGRGRCRTWPARRTRRSSPDGRGGLARHRTPIGAVVAGQVVVRQGGGDELGQAGVPVDPLGVRCGATRTNSSSGSGPRETSSASRRSSGRRPGTQGTPRRRAGAGHARCSWSGRERAGACAGPGAQHDDLTIGPCGPMRKARGSGAGVTDLSTRSTSSSAECGKSVPRVAGFAKWRRRRRARGRRRRCAVDDRLGDLAYLLDAGVGDDAQPRIAEVQQDVGALLAAHTKHRVGEGAPSPRALATALSATMSAGDAHHQGPERPGADAVRATSDRPGGPPRGGRSRPRGPDAARPKLDQHGAARASSATGTSIRRARPARFVARAHATSTPLRRP